MPAPSQPTQLSCPQCGASVVVRSAALASRCAFCESSLVRVDHRAQRIDTLAPFRLTAEQAAGRLAAHIARGWLVPRALQAAADPRRLKGVFVPFWCYDAQVESRWTAKQGIHWTETETYTVHRNGKTETRTRTVRHTEWFPTRGTHVREYTDHLVSGSRGLSEAEANALEPFDLGRGQPFDPALLAGWLAEYPTLGHAEATKTARQELARRENGAIRAFLPADEVEEVRNETRSEVSELRLVLLPVWVARHRHGGRVVRMLVNGQTGEVVARLPTDKKKVAALVGAGLAVLAVLVGALVVAGGLR